MSKSKPDQPKAICGKCVYFQNDPAALEDVYRGLTVMSSGFASVRAEDGLCNRHDLYLSFWDSCPGYTPRAFQVRSNKNLSAHDSHEQFSVLLPSTSFQHDALARSVAAGIVGQQVAETEVLATLYDQSQTRADSAAGTLHRFVDLILPGVNFP